MIEITNSHVQIVKKSKQKITRRQDAPKTYDMNASIYIWKREALLFSDDLFTTKTSLYKMTEKQSIDIDNDNDLSIVEFLLKNTLASLYGSPGQLEDLQPSWNRISCVWSGWNFGCLWSACQVGMICIKDQYAQH